MKQFQGSTFDEFSRRRLTARIYEVQNEVNCLNDSREFKDAEAVHSGLSHVPSQPALFAPFRDPGGMLSRSVGMLSRNDQPADIWDTHGISGNVFVNPTASSSTPYPGGFNPWISNVTEDTSPHVSLRRHAHLPEHTLPPFSAQDVVLAAKKLKPSRVTVCDYWSPAEFLALPREAQEELAALFSVRLSESDSSLHKLQSTLSH